MDDAAEKKFNERRSQRVRRACGGPVDAAKTAGKGRCATLAWLRHPALSQSRPGSCGSYPAEVGMMEDLNVHWFLRGWRDLAVCGGCRGSAHGRRRARHPGG